MNILCRLSNPVDDPARTIGVVTAAAQGYSRAGACDTGSNLLFIVKLKLKSQPQEYHRMTFYEILD